MITTNYGRQYISKSPRLSIIFHLVRGAKELRVADVVAMAAGSGRGRARSQQWHVVVAWIRTIHQVTRHEQNSSLREPSWIALACQGNLSK
jgi:hypothetical protein